MLLRLVTRYLTRNGSIVAWSLATLAASGALATIFFTVSLDVGEKMSRTLRSLGANAVARATSATDWQVARQRMVDLGTDVTLLNLRVGTLAGRPVAVVAADARGLERMTAYWALTGRRANAGGECLIGRKLADVVKVRTGANIEVAFAVLGETQQCQVTGVFESGDEDEDRVFVTTSTGVAVLFGTTYALLSVPPEAGGIGRLQNTLRAMGVPIEIMPLRQILHGDQQVVKKVTLLAGIALLAVMVLGALGSSAAAISRVLSRRKELALMQALGAKHRSVVAVLISEGALTGAAAAVLGFAIGSVLAHAVVAQVFHVSVTPRLASFAGAGVVTALVSVVAAAIGARHALRMDTAVLLKGD